jgi:hypothetical protein
MPELETPEELAEKIANWCGVYGAHGDQYEPDGVRCTDEKPCRSCFVMDLTRRIREAVANEKLLEGKES